MRSKLGSLRGWRYRVNPSPALREMPTCPSNAWRTRIRPRLAAAVLAVLSSAVAVTAVAVSLLATPSLDVATDARGTITWVLPGGGSWQAGIRPGQQVISLAYGPRGETWQLDTIDASGTGHGASYTGHLTALRSTLPFGIAACLSALLALIAFARRHRLSGALALLALLLAEPGLRLAGDAAAATVVVGGTPLVAAGWLAVSTCERWARGALLIAAALTVAWAAARELVVGAFDVTDTLSLALASALVGVALITAVPWRRWAGAAAYVEPSVAADLGVVGLVLGLAVVAVTTLSAPPWAVLGGAVVLFALYPRVRRRLSRLLEELVLGSARQHASIAATEEERARLAHEIHDGPLQELAAVIGRLDDEPQLISEAGLLRDVAAELRAVTTALRPPVLDDLGLGAAVAFVVDQARAQSAASTTIACEVEDRAGPGRTGRAPGDVELAGFRVAQEALANAVRHAHARHIIVAGLVSAAEVRLRISDDGTGIDPAAVRDARRGGHLGLMSMRQRAAAVGAELAVDSRPGDGTEVLFEWGADR
jgi:signal transduction histidine kinase